MGRGPTTRPLPIGAASVRAARRVLPREVLEPRVLVDEGEVRGPDGPVALLADDQLRDPLHVLLVLLVDLFPEDEEDGVIILLVRSELVRDDATREPRCRAGNRQIEDLLLTGGLDGQDAVPEQVAGRGTRKGIAVRQPCRVCDDGAR